MSINRIGFSPTPLFGVFLGVAETMLVSCCFVMWSHSGDCIRPKHQVNLVLKMLLGFLCLTLSGLPKLANLSTYGKIYIC